MSKYSPGPYRLSRRDGSIAIYSDAAACRVATVHRNDNTEAGVVGVPENLLGVHRSKWPGQLQLGGEDQGGHQEGGGEMKYTKSVDGKLRANINIQFRLTKDEIAFLRRKHGDLWRTVIAYALDWDMLFEVTGGKDELMGGAGKLKPNRRKSKRLQSASKSL